MSTSPSAAVVAAFQALHERDWRALFAVLDPEAVAEFKSWQLSQLAPYQKAPSSETMSLREVFAVRSIAELRALHPALVLRRWFVVHYGSRPHGPSSPPTVLGDVAEGADLAYVLFRETPSPQYPRQLLRDDVPRVVTVRRVNGDWRMTLGGGLVFNEGGSYFWHTSGETDPTEGEDGFLDPGT